MRKLGQLIQAPLPVNYNIIINSPTSYGQMFVTSEAGSTDFGLSSVSTNLFNGKYSNVMTGVSDGNVGATRSGSLDGNGTSSAGTANWVLSETASGSSAWDLNITGDYVYFGSVATLQSSVNNTASAMRGAFNSITSSMNFANMTTMIVTCLVIMAVVSPSVAVIPAQIIQIPQQPRWWLKPVISLMNTSDMGRLWIKPRTLKPAMWIWT